MGKAVVADAGGGFVDNANSWIELVLGALGILAAATAFRAWWRKKCEARQRRKMSTVLSAIEDLGRKQDEREHALGARLDLIEQAAEGLESRFVEHIEGRAAVVEQLNSRLEENHQLITSLVQLVAAKESA